MFVVQRTPRRWSESFLEISVEVKPNSSIQQCLSDFSASELLGGEDKFQCDSCSGLHEAHKRLLIRTAPSVLAIHLKRFKYVESVGRMQKLNHRVAFSRELKLPNLSADSTSSDDLCLLCRRHPHRAVQPRPLRLLCSNLWLQSQRRWRQRTVGHVRRRNCSRHEHGRVRICFWK